MLGLSLAEYNIFTNPTEGNINQLMLKAGKNALLRNPCFAFQSLVKGMNENPIWRRFSEPHITAWFALNQPSPEKLIKCLLVTEENKQEGKVVTWLHRYIRGCSKNQLHKLVRFITGAVSITPTVIIKVTFVDQMVTSLLPGSKTCIKILYVPRQYFSFTNLISNFDFYFDSKSTWSVHD